MTQKQSSITQNATASFFHASSKDSQNVTAHTTPIQKAASHSPLSRREFVIFGTLAGLCFCMPLFGSGSEIVATGIVEVFGDGARLSAIAITLNDSLKKKFMRQKDMNTIISIYELDLKTNNPHKRNIQKAHITTDKDKQYLILELDMDALSLKDMQSTKPKERFKEGDPKISHSNPPNAPKKKKWIAGEKSEHNLHFLTPQAKITIDSNTFSLNDLRYPIVDEFQTLRFEGFGKVLQYNLFIPKAHRNATGKKPLPLVLFMHDAGASSDYARATLLQGRGAISFASDAWQERQPCYVLAPQYDEIIVDDNSNASNMLELTINLIKSLAKQHAIDMNRIYTTGQSGGCMMSIAMMIQYPQFFAAAFLVAGQWRAELCLPLKEQNLFVLVSADDLGAYPGQNAIMEFLEKHGAKIARATWNGKWGQKEYQAAYTMLMKQDSKINYVVFEKGSVFLPNADTKGASGHRNTWRIAYDITPIKEWLFKHSLSGKL